MGCLELDNFLLAEVPDWHGQQIIVVFIWVLVISWLAYLGRHDSSELTKLLILISSQLPDPRILPIHHLKLAHHNRINKLYFGIQYLQFSPTLGYQISFPSGISFNSFLIKLFHNISNGIIFFNLVLWIEHDHISLL